MLSPLRLRLCSRKPLLPLLLLPFCQLLSRREALLIFLLSIALRLLLSRRQALLSLQRPEGVGEWRGSARLRASGLLLPPLLPLLLRLLLPRLRTSWELRRPLVPCLPLALVLLPLLLPSQSSAGSRGPPSRQLVSPGPLLRCGSGPRSRYRSNPLRSSKNQAPGLVSGLARLDLLQGPTSGSRSIRSSCAHLSAPGLIGRLAWPIPTVQISAPVAKVGEEWLLRPPLIRASGRRRLLVQLAGSWRSLGGIQQQRRRPASGRLRCCRQRQLPSDDALHSSSSCGEKQLVRSC